MMGASFILANIKPKATIEALKCATQMDGLMGVEVKGKVATRDTQLMGVNENLVTNMRT